MAQATRTEQQAKRMSTRTLGPGAGFGWIKRAINLGSGNPKAIIGAAVLVMLVSLVPSVINALAQYALAASPSAAASIVVVTTLLSLLVYPLLTGGMLRVIHATETGRPVVATDVFNTFSPEGGMARLIGFGVLMTLAYIGFFVALVMGLLGPEVVDWYVQLLAASASMDPAATSGTTPALPTPPDGFGLFVALALLFGLFFGGVYTLGFGQVAIGGHGIGKALADGVTGTLKNALPIVLLAIVAFIGLFLLAIAGTLIVVLLGLVGGLVHPTFGAILAIPAYLVLLLVIYVVIFGIMYFMWRDICSQEPVATTDNQIEM